jgi:hypothetical protein
MRDQDYHLKPAPGTYRMAILGPSNVMGWGVGDGETFEALVEARLNREKAGKPFAKYEILNFGVPGYDPPQQLVAFERAVTFGPNAVLYVATGREITRAARFLAGIAKGRIDIPYPALKDIVARAGLDPEMDGATAARRLEPFRRDILAAVYGQIAQQSRARGIVPVWIFLPQVREGTWQEETPETVRLAETAGFIVVNLSDVYKGEDLTAIRLAEWDEHPNARAHQLIAARIYDALKEKRDVIFGTAGRHKAR